MPGRRVSSRSEPGLLVPVVCGLLTAELGTQAAGSRLPDPRAQWWLTGRAAPRDLHGSGVDP